MKFLRDYLSKVAGLLAIGSVVLTGCQSNNGGSAAAKEKQSEEHLRIDPLHAGDGVRIEFSGTPTQLPPVQTDIKGDGMVRLNYIGDVPAEGKTPGELEQLIQQKYVPDYYTHLSVSVTPTMRFFYVTGQINGGPGSGRVQYNGQITVTRAIASAGDFNPFADKKHVRLYRADGSYKVVNCVKALDNPKLDLPVYPGDKIFVPLRAY